MESEVSCPGNNQWARLEAGLSWADICWALCYSFIRGIFHIYWAAYVLLGLHFIDGETDSETLSHSPKITQEDHDDFPGSHSILTAGKWQIKKWKTGPYDFKPISYYRSTWPLELIQYLGSSLHFLRFRGNTHSWAVSILHKGAQARAWGWGVNIQLVLCLPSQVPAEDSSAKR